MNVTERIPITPPLPRLLAIIPERSNPGFVWYLCCGEAHIAYKQKYGPYLLTGGCPLHKKLAMRHARKEGDFLVCEVNSDR